jgi:DNA mismatch repair protein MutS2
LDAKNRILVISGPNAGGKSVILKSAGIIQLMFQFGMLVPVDEGSVLCVFKKLFIDIDDDQSIENDVSTYSSHLQKMRHFVLNADPHSLVLLDEMGVGTDPSLGGAMAEAVLQVLNDKKVFGIVTTHFHNLKVFASQTPGMQSAAMAFDRQELQPLYQLLPGQPGSSFTFEIAQKTGMPQSVIQLAREKTGENKKALDDTLSEMQVEKQFIRGIRKNVQKQEEQLGDLVKNYQHLKKELEKDKKKLQRQYEQKLLDMFNENSRELEKMMREWKEDRADKAKFDQARNYIDEQRATLEKKLDEKMNESPGDASGVIEAGSRVRMEDGQEAGIVKEIKKDQATVAFGNMLTKVKLNRLVLIPADEPEKKTYAIRKDPGNIMEKSVFDLSLDVRGLLKDETYIALENFLDKALMYGVSKLKIIHGRGTGALRQAVQSYLKKYPYVKTFYSEQEQYGGNGITIVEMK